MAAVSSAHHMPMKALSPRDDDPYSPPSGSAVDYSPPSGEPHSPTTRDTATPDFDAEDRNIHTSSFSIHNVLKKERDGNTPEREEEREYESSESMRAEISVDDASCCSDDTVLSVGNEVPNTYSSESASKSTPNSPGTPPSLTSFKHIETHLNAISQLSHMAQPLLLRPNPITPNPLMFLNQQQLLFQNPLINPEKPIIHNRIPIGLNQPNLALRQNLNSFLTPKNDEERRENLKFSIDNILKADFGRRITDPLKRKNLKRQAVKVTDVSVKTDECSARLTDSEKSAVDLTKGDEGGSGSGGGTKGPDGQMVWPAWVYCTRYSDRPSSGRSKYGTSSRLQRPRTRRPKKPPGDSDEKRPRTAFSGPQLARLKHEFAENRYLTERRRQALAAELGLAEAQIKIWFQNKRAKIKKASGQRNPLALQLMAQGLYNHSTVPLTKEEEELEMKARERERQLQQ